MKQHHLLRTLVTATLLLGFVLIAAPRAFAQGPATVYIDDDWVGALPGSDPDGAGPATSFGYDAFATIQGGIDGVAPGGTTVVAAGTYQETLNIDARAGLTIDGADAASVLVQPTATLCWNVPGNACGRSTGVRVVNSTDIVFQDMTFDWALIAGNNISGLLIWDSTATVSNSVLENMSLPDAVAYYELTAYVRAPGYTPAARAQVSFVDNTFIDTGRLGIVTHDYVHAIIDGNTFYKTVDDFGYAMEIGSESTAAITGNTIYGYDTAAASDGSNSAGIYIENAFTYDTPTQVVKSVLVENNEIYGCQYALYVGNEFDGYAGDVDIQVTANNNNLHDNVNGAVVITDEDSSAGSSVSFVGSGNTLASNGDVGYLIYTWGDGDLTVSLSGETITGHVEGVYLNDYATGASGSSYTVSIDGSTISGNTSAGVQNDYAGTTIVGEGNWWGAASGPSAPANPGGTGDAVSSGVDFGPWLGLPPGTSPMTWYTNDSIQAAVDAASPGDTVVVAAGTYVEQVEIAKALTLTGAGPTTIIQSPVDLVKFFATSVDNYPIVYIHDANDVIVQDLTVDGAGLGNLNYRFDGVAYRNAGGTVQRVAINDVRDTPFSGAQHGVALYVYNDDLVSRTINVYDSTFTGFQKNAMALNAGDTTPLVVDVQRNVVTGAGATAVTAQNGIQVWADLGSGTVADNVIDGIAYAGSGWVASSILNYYADLDITGNTITNAHMGIYNIEGAGLIADNDLTLEKAGGFAYGIVATDPPQAVPAPFGQDDGEGKGTSAGETVQAVLDVEISGNSVVVEGTDRTSTFCIEADAGYSDDTLNLDIDDNTVSNCEVAIEIYKCQSGCDPAGSFGIVSANGNNLGGNGYGIRSNDPSITVDGRYNWWGAASGPYHPTLNPTGAGSWVSDNVNFAPYFQPTWQKYAGNPVVTGSMALDPSVIKDGATYKMWYTHVDDSGVWSIYYADSADGITWANQQQVLAAGSGWDGTRVMGPSVILDGTTYKMWYTGRDANTVYSIGYAESADGLTWTNRQQVLTPTAGAWDSAMVREPSVILDAGTYHMWYEGTDLWPAFAIGYATSTDGLTWTKHAGNPVFSGTPDGWDGFQVYAPSVVLDNGVYYMYFSGTDNNMSERWSTGWATSSDGVTWTEAARNPILIPEGDDSLDYVSAMNDEGTWKIWYSYGGSYAIGLATMEFGTELYIAPAIASIANDHTTTQVFTIQMVNAVDVYGYQFVFTFDPANVEATAAAFDNSFFDTPMGSPPGWNATIDNVAGRVYFARTRQYPQAGVSGSGPLATITLRGRAGAAADQYRLDFDLERLGDIDGNPLDVTTQHGWLALYGAGDLQGTVDLQGRPVESGAVVTIMTASGYMDSMTITDPTGAWSFSGVPAGSYQVNIEMDRYLDSQRGASGSGVAIPAGGTTVLSQLRMLGGDADDDDTVTISDAVIIGSMYGLTAPADVRADINNDGIVDVLDLVLLGGNFTKTSPTEWL